MSWIYLFINLLFFIYLDLYYNVERKLRLNYNSKKHLWRYDDDADSKRLR